MKVQVYSFDKFIVTADLKTGDESMGHLYGEFTPTEIYYKDVQQKVWDIYNTINPCDNCWESLRLTAINSEGFGINAAGGITLCDSEEMPDEPKRLDIAGVNLETLSLE